jgi:glycosyltransferase involved in cell wall biosynthesis/2-polyprenyl-3-methyl-5-hydroxy-6-metoxy-1,4-benzoquinol methylase
MKPSLPHHATTSLHRVPGGLHTLDLLIKRIAYYADEHPDQELNILVQGDETALFALPIATLGYCVTNLHKSETSAQKTQALSEELGLEIQSKTTQLQEEQSGKYDIVISPMLSDTATEITSSINTMIDKIKTHGAILFRVSASEKLNYPALLTVINATKTRTYSSLVSNYLSPSFFSKHLSKMKKGSALFHTIDLIDSMLSNKVARKRASSWVFECRKKIAPKLVAYILPTLSAGGGAERLVMQLAARMPEQGYESHIIANVRGGGLEALLRKQNIPFTVLHRKGIFGRFKNIKQLKHLLQDLNPDIVHTHLFAADFWGRIAARRAKIKNIVTTLHNVKIHFGSIGIQIMRALKSYSKIYVAISFDVAEYLKKTIKVSKDKVKIIQNGVESSKIVKRQNQPFHDIPRFVFIGRLESQKNPDILLKALAEVRGSWECFIYGEGSMERDLKHLADELGILPRLYWEGVVENTHSVYSKNDVFILPSAWEGFGLVAVEAAVAGIPMIVSDLPVMKELFGEKVTKVTPGSIEELTKAIEDILGRPADAIAQAQHLASEDFTKFSIDRMASEHVKLYNSITKQ